MRALILSLFVLSSNAFAADVRALFYALDDDAVIREVDASASPSVAERAMRIASLMRLGAAGRAFSEAEKLRDAHPNDPWSWYAIAIGTSLEAIDGSAKMMELAGNDADEEMVALRARILCETGKCAEALALLDRHPASPHLLVSRGLVLGRGRAPDDFDPKMYTAFDEALKLDPNSVEAMFWSASYRMMETRGADALPLYERAVELTHAPRVHGELWSALKREKQEVVPAIEASLAKVPTPLMMQTAAATYRSLGDRTKAAQLEERVLAEAPASLAAQLVLRDRATDGGGDAVAATRTFASWPQSFDPYLRTHAHYLWFSALQQTGKAKNEEVLAAIRGMLHEWQPSRYAVAAVALADRKFALEEAERLARDGMRAFETRLAAVRKRGGAQNDEYEKSQRALVHDALGWVLLNRGNASDATRELDAAWKLNPRSTLIAYHLGKLYESQRQLAKAESMYRAGLKIAASPKNPNLDALKAIYESRHGSLKGFEESIREVKSADTATRRREVLAARVDKSLPPFELKTLDGRAMSHRDLAGRIAVINFWGLWCAPCVSEMPQFQQLVKKYAKDDRVAIVTINSGDDPERVRKWMAETKYAFPVLLDNRWARKHVRGFPTAWFVDPSGMIAFEARGASDRLVEEFSWRIEALR